jgi:hypothetical protein
MDWEQLGYMFGNGLMTNYAQNYRRRGEDKARDILTGIGDPNADDRKRAQAMADAHYGNGLVGQNPQTLLLQAKRDWMQADNDAQYLLNNGYAEDSPDVQKFREIQAKAHGHAEFLRGLGKSTGVDLSKVGAGMGLADLKDAVNRGIAPMMYKEYPQLQEQMEKRNAWAGQTARDILSGQIGQGVQPIAPISNSQATPQPVNPQPVTGTAPMSPPAAQLGGYAPQGTNLLNFDPNAGFGMTGTANPTQPGQNNSHGRAISGADIFQFLQERGVIPKERTYAEEVEDIAKAFAQQRASKMDDREIRKYLKDNGVPSDIAKLVMAERKQQAQEAMKQNALLQAAKSSSSEQMAALIMAAAADPRTRFSDIKGLIEATNPNMQLDTIDLGGTKVAMTRDAKGRVRGGAQTLPVTISPKDLAGLQYNYDSLGYRAKNDAANRDAANYRAKLASDTSLQAAAMRASGRSGSGGRGGAQQGGLKVNEALNILKQAQAWDDEHPDQEWANPLSDARDRALVMLNEYGDVDPSDETSVYRFGQSILEENARDGYPYTTEELRQIILSIGGDWAEQAAENLLSGQGVEYGR